MARGREPVAPHGSGATGHCGQDVGGGLTPSLHQLDEGRLRNLGLSP